MGRSPCCDKNGLKKGPWTQEEDLKLMEYIQVQGPGNWRTLPKNAGLQRCGKSCRLRWTNYLRPDIKRGRFSFEEEETIIQLHSVLGNKWSAIAARLPGRTDNEIKNYWNTHIRKRLLRMGIDPVTHSPRLDLLDLSSLLNSAAVAAHHQLNLSNLLGLQTLVANPELLRLATTLMAATTSTTTTTTSTSTINENHQILNDHDHDHDHDQNNNKNQVMFQNDLLAVQENIINDQSAATSTATLTPTLATQEQIQMNPDYFNYNGFQEMLSMPNSNANDHDHLLLSPLDHQVVLQHEDNLLYYAGAGDNSYNNGTLFPDQIQQIYNHNYMQNHNINGSSSTTTSGSPLNSSSTNLINSSSSATEDERESYCSSIMKFEIPASLDFDDFM